MNFARHLSFLLPALPATTAAFSQARVPEVPGSHDHSLVSRFAGSVLQNVADEKYASVRVPAGPGRIGNGGLTFDKVTAVEGHVSSYFYVAPKDT